VPRAVAILLGLVLASAAGQVSLLHIHLYSDHDHPEHHHGLAAHEHNRPAEHHDDGDHDQAVHLESCDPGQHAIALTMACGPQPPTQASDGVGRSLILDGLLAPIRSVTELTDVRVHGPPPLTEAPPRAPPLIFPA
jgi:hypothetical protein